MRPSKGSYSHRHRPNWCYWALHWPWLSPGDEGEGRDTELQLLPGNLSPRAATTADPGGTGPGDRQGRDKCKYPCPRSAEGQHWDSNRSKGDAQPLLCDTGTHMGTRGDGDTGKGQPREGTQGAARVPPSPRRSPFPLSQLPSRTGPGALHRSEQPLPLPARAPRPGLSGTAGSRSLSPRGNPRGILPRRRWAGCPARTPPAPCPGSPSRPHRNLLPHRPSPGRTHNRLGHGAARGPRGALRAAQTRPGPARPAPFLPALPGPARPFPAPPGPARRLPGPARPQPAPPGPAPRHRVPPHQCSYPGVTTIMVPPCCLGVIP